MENETWPKPWHIIPLLGLCGGGYNLCGNVDRLLTHIITANNNRLVGSFCSKECAQAYMEQHNAL